MIDTKALLGQMITKSISREYMAKTLTDRGFKMNYDTFCRRLRKKKFYNDEIEAMAEILQLKDKNAIFFAKQ